MVYSPANLQGYLGDDEALVEGFTGVLATV
jgi:hypothetical protein